jgi:tRNA (guanine-N7-)-methyltransferase
VVELIPESYVARLDLPKIFGRIAPLQVDLGCGDGAFLCALAKRVPEKNFLGIERMTGRVEKAGRKATGVENVRVLHVETFYAVKYLLPEQSVECFYLLFPDPWPKRRHQQRRVVRPDFLDAIHAALVPNGVLQIATDQADYSDYIKRVTGDFAIFALTEWKGEQEFPTSTFEKRFRSQGAPIHRLELRKI